MPSINCKRSRALWGQGFAALWAMLAMGLGALASRAEAAPFTYVANSGDGTVSVIDTATRKVVATIPVGKGGGGAVTPDDGVAVTPDGKRAYVANSGSNTVSVIDTVSNKVVGTVQVGNDPHGVAVSPDGTHVYIANFSPDNTVSVIETVTNTVVASPQGGGFPFGVAVTPDGKDVYVTNLYGDSVIDTASNTVVATVPEGNYDMGIAVTPDGKRVYVTNARDGGLHLVSVIDTASKQVVATVAGVGFGPLAIAITPDGNYAYVTNLGSNTVSVIATATNTVVATIPDVSSPSGVAVTPDGKHAYVSNGGSNTVSVIATASNKVVDIIPVGNGPSAVGIVPPPPGVPFLAFNAKLEINYAPNEDVQVFELQSNFTLGSASHGIHPETDSVKLEIGTFTATIPAGSFEGKGFGPFEFRGVIDGVDLHVEIEPTGAKRYDLKARARDANLIGTTNPVQVTLIIGDDSGTVSVKATNLSEVAWLGRRRVP